MAYECPRCGEAVQRGQSTGAAVAGGLIGSLLYSAFGSFECKQCGKIPKSEFSPEDQAMMTRGTIFMVLSAVLVFMIALVLLAWLSA